MSAACCTLCGGDDYTLYGLWALLFFATIVVSIAIDTLTTQSRKEQPDTCSGKSSPTSAGEQHERQNLLPDQPCRDDDGTSPISRRNKLVAVVMFLVLVAPLFLVFCLFTYEWLLLDTNKPGLSAGIYFGSTLIFMVLLSFLTTANLHEILAAADAYVFIAYPAPGGTERQIGCICKGH